jgi:hypothetical protein
MEVTRQLHALAALHKGKSTQYPFDRLLGGPPEPVWTGGIEKNSQAVPGIELRSPPSRYTDRAIPAPIDRHVLTQN